MSGDRPTAHGGITPPENGVESRASPYFGLSYYDQQFGAWFFGRESERVKVISNLQATRLTLLHANSGVGKTSILRAGVAWRLSKLALDATEDRDIPIVFSSWTDDPVSGLVRAISKAIEPFVDRNSVPELPRDDLSSAIDLAAHATGSTLAIILDQFEEYFLYSSTESPPERFANQFAAAIKRSDLPVSFLIAIREDAYAALGDLFMGRLPNVYGNYLAVDYLDQLDARDAICKPLEVYNRQAGVTQMRIEPGLVDAVIEQVRIRDGLDQDSTSRLNSTPRLNRPASNEARSNGSQMGPGTRSAAPVSAEPNGAPIRVETPLLQLAMQSVWVAERAEGSTVLRQSTLAKLGGADSIVDTHLDKELAALDDDERRVAIDVFDHLVTPSGGKIAEAIPDLAARTAHDEQQIRNALEKLDRARIVRSVQAPPSRDPVRYRRYEIYHDVLAPAINRSITQREEERLKAEADAEARRARRLRNVAIIAGTAAVVAIGLLILALAFRQNAIDATHRAQSQLLASEATADSSDLQLASLRAIEAWRISPTVDARSAILTIADSHELGAPLTGHGRLVQSVAFSPNGKMLASGGRDGRVGFWEVAAHREIAMRYAGGSTVYSVAFSPDGTTLASGSGDGTIRLWDVATRSQVAALRAAQASRVESVAFSPDGKTLAAGSRDGTIRLWNVASRRQLGGAIAGRGGLVFMVAFSRDGRTLAAADADGTIRLYGVSSHRRIGRPLRGHLGQVYSVAFSPDGRTLASAGSDETVRLWSAATNREFGRRLTGHISGVHSVAFSPDGRTLASSSFDGTVKLWDVAGQVQLASFSGHVGAAESVAFSPDGRMLASGGADGTIRLWVVASQRQIGEALTDHTTGVLSVAFSPGGRIIASGSRDNKIRLWDAGSGRALGRPFTAGTSPISGVAFSPSGKILASSSFDHKIRLWDVASHTELGAPLSGNPEGVEGVAFSPNGKILASADVDHTVRLWDVAGHRQIGVLAGHRDIVYSVAFSPDGKTVASGSYDGAVRLWNAATHRTIGAPIKGDGSAISGIGFSPSGKILAVGNTSGTILLFNTSTRQQLGAPLAGNGNAVESVAFSPDGKTLVSGGEDGTVRFWDVATRRQLGDALTAGGAPVKSVAFSPDDRTVASGSDDGSIRRWTNDPIGVYIRQLCNYIDPRRAARLWSASEPSIPYRQPCGS